MIDPKLEDKSINCVVAVDKIKVGSKFKAPTQIGIASTELEKAERWWVSLPDHQKCAIYWEYLDCVQVE